MSTITTIAGSDVVANSRATINTNFSNLNADKVEGPSSSVDSEVALFNSTTGKLIKRASATGIAKLTSGVLSAITDSSGLASAISDETGSGALVFGTSPTLTTPTISSPVIKSWTGWQLYDTVTPTYTSADDPTYVITFAAVDLTSVMSVGMKVKFTNNSTTFYGIITAIAFSTNTTVTLYGGTDYDVANSAISGFYFSTDRCPQGFPMDPTKWTVTTTDTTERTQTSPVENTWYNLGSNSISIPIGAWSVEYFTTVYTDDTGGLLGNRYVTLSTANNSESDADFTTGSQISGFTATTAIGLIEHYRRKTLVLAAKTAYYLNEKVGNSSNVDTLRINASVASDTTKTIIRAICSYL